MEVPKYTTQFSFYMETIFEIKREINSKETQKYMIIGI